MSQRGQPFDPAPYRRELDALHQQFGRRLSVLITEPYLGGGGSYHPPAAYLQILQAFCRENDLIFILDEVQSNFGRTGDLFAFETYGLEPDVVVLGKGLGNGVPVAAAADAPICSGRSITARRRTPGAPTALLRRRAGHAGRVRRRQCAGPQPAGVGGAGGRLGSVERIAVYCSYKRGKGRYGLGRGDCATTPAAARRSGRMRWF